MFVITIQDVLVLTDLPTQIGKWNVKLEMQLTILKPEGAGLLPIPIITDVKIKGYTHINRENCLGSFLLKK